MARACVKVFIGDKLVRVFGGNSSQVVQEIVRLKEGTREELSSSYPSLLENNELRYTSIRHKRRNKVYRMYELIEDINEEDVITCIQDLNVLVRLMDEMKDVTTKMNVELKFTEQGELLEDYTIDELVRGFVRKKYISSFGKRHILSKILNRVERQYASC